MNAHHPKHMAQLPQRSAHKMVFHERIVNRLGLAPFKPLEDKAYVEASKKGCFNQSTCAIALYTNAFTGKAMFPSDLAPFGYMNKAFDDVFSFGVYRRHDGELFGCIVPLRATLKTMVEFTKLAMAELPIHGVYVRFLRTTQYVPLVSAYDFKPAKEEPWLPDAPEEDESLSHSRVNLSKMFRPDDPMPLFAPLRKNVLRAKNYLDRNGLDYRLVPLTVQDIPLAQDIVRLHFDLLEEKGKLVGSTYRDYLGLLHPDIIALREVSALIGMLGTLPVSLFITEGNGDLSNSPAVSGYAGITLRNVDYAFGKIPREPGKPLDEDLIIPQYWRRMVGSSSIPTYAFSQLFYLKYMNGYNLFHMGGSEHADIDTWKRKQMDAERDPTYWAVYTKP